MVWAGRVATILPGTGRPTDCLGGSVCRHVARYDRTYNCWYFETNNESNDDAKNFWNNCWHDFLNFSRFNPGYNQPFRSRYSSLFR
jgi:hypothetical protein